MVPELGVFIEGFTGCKISLAVLDLGQKFENIILKNIMNELIN